MVMNVNKFSKCVFHLYMVLGITAGHRKVMTRMFHGGAYIFMPPCTLGGWKHYVFRLSIERVCALAWWCPSEIFLAQYLHNECMNLFQILCKVCHDQIWEKIQLWSHNLRSKDQRQSSPHNQIWANYSFGPITPFRWTMCWLSLIEKTYKDRALLESCRSANSGQGAGAPKLGASSFESLTTQAANAILFVQQYQTHRRSICISPLVHN